MDRGREIYQRLCVDCHGEAGEGVAGSYEQPLAGDLSVGELGGLIERTMPEGEPEACVGGDALAVAAFIHESFYGAAAQQRNRPPRRQLSRLTGHQLRHSLADLYAHFAGVPGPSDEEGLKASYSSGGRRKKDSDERSEKKEFDRVDPYIQFDFGHKGPGKGLDAEEYRINWRGAVLAPREGRYEIVVRSTASFTMDFVGSDNKFFDNHVQSADRTEFRRMVYLLAGRPYPITLSLNQRDRKTEQPPVSVSLAWVPPEGVEQIIPAENLLPVSVPAAFSLQTPLPADDRSYGYDRGIAVSRQWDDAITAAAVEFSQAVENELWPRYRDRHQRDAGSDREKMQKFLAELVQVAFRGLADDELISKYVTNQLAVTEDDTEAIRRVVLFAIKSPWFLYPTLSEQGSPSQVAASRLSTVLFDSLPSEQWIIDQAAQGKLATAEQVRSAAQRMVQDRRAQAKLREMLYGYLKLEGLGDLSKDQKMYAGFDGAMISDLRASLDATLDDVLDEPGSDFRRLFTMDYAYATPRMTEFYGRGWRDAAEEASDAAAVKTAPEGDRIRPPTLKAPFDGDVAGAADGSANPLPPVQLYRTVSDPTHHGVLTHPLLMSGLAYHDTSSPIHRGVFLTRNVFGRTLRPPNEAFTPFSADLHPGLTTRERVTLQTSGDACIGCHSRINGVGFLLENYDAVGRYREEESGKRLDVDGLYIAADGEQAELSGADGLAAYIAESDDAVSAFVERAFEHYTKQPIGGFGPDVKSHLEKSFRDSNFNIRQLIVEIAVAAAQAPSLVTSPEV